MQEIKEVSRLRFLGMSQRKIAMQCRLSRNTVQMYFKMLDAKSAVYHQIKDLDDLQLQEFLDLKPSNREVHYALPDYSKLVDELSKPGVTMQLLWEEYVAHSRRKQQLYYQITQFKKYFHEYLTTNSFTDIIHHKPGERIEVDWDGTPVTYQDPDHGGNIKASLFVAVLPFSGYAFAWAYADQKQANWIDAHIRLFNYFGGVSRILVPDNLKTGVIKHPKHEEPILNVSYQEMAEYYGCVIIPTRVRKPKDKPSVENSVNQMTRFIIARLRNHQFFSLQEYNEQLLIMLDEFNHKAFQKKPGSRFDAFTQIEKPLLMPLPLHQYEYCQWRKAKVQNNSHIQFERHYYSVPYRFIGQEIDLKIYPNHLEMIVSGALIAKHERKAINIGEYSTITEHMPPHSQIHETWSKERFLNEAAQIGPYTTQVIQYHFDIVKVETQGYRTVVSILKLGTLYSFARLENACRLMIDQGQYPRYKHLKTLLKNGQDQLINHHHQQVVNDEKAFIRGGQYYARQN